MCKYKIRITGTRHAEHLPSATPGLSAKQQEQVLDAHYQDIQDCLNLDEVFPHLCQHHLLTSTEKQELLNQTSITNHKIRKLMMWIPPKGPNALHHFITCLRHSADGTGHQELADKLEKEARKGQHHTTKQGIDGCFVQVLLCIYWVYDSSSNMAVHVDGMAALITYIPLVCLLQLLLQFRYN